MGGSGTFSELGAGIVVAAAGVAVGSAAAEFVVAAGSMAGVADNPDGKALADPSKLF